MSVLRFSMRSRHFPPSVSFLFAFSTLLLLFSAAKWIETDGGKILIHSIDIELTETIYTGGRLYRPLEAQSLNQRPAILLIAGVQSDKDTLAPLAVELARRGFVALTVDNFGQGNTPSALSNPQLNIINSARLLLESQTFVDKKRIGFAGYTLGTTSGLSVADLSWFQSVVLIAPDDTVLQRFANSNKPANVLILQSAIESTFTANAAEKAQKSYTIRNFHIPQFFLPLHPGCIAAALNWFQNALKIPDDLPLWFDPAAQLGSVREVLLLAAYLILLFMLKWLCEFFQLRYTIQPNTAPKDRTSEIITGKRAVLLWVIGSLALWLLSVPATARFFETVGSNSANGLIYWIFSLGIFMLIIRMVCAAMQKQPLIGEIRFGFFLRTAGTVAILFFFLYLSVWVLSRVFMLETHFLIPLLRPLPAERWMAFTAAFVISAFFFWNYSHLFISAPAGTQGVTRFILAGISALLIFLLIEYGPRFAFGHSGWEWLTSVFFPDQGSIFPETGWRFAGSAAFSGTLLIASLLWMQAMLVRRTSDALSGSLLCGALLAWSLISGATFF